MPEVTVNKYTFVEKALVEQLQALGWEHLEGDIDVPYLTDRESFRQVLLEQRLREALRRANTTEDGEEWLDEVRVKVFTAENGFARERLKNRVFSDEDFVARSSSGSTANWRRRICCAVPARARASLWGEPGCAKRGGGPFCAVVPRPTPPRGWPRTWRVSPTG